MKKRRQTACHPEPPKDTKCRRTVEGPPDSVPRFFVTQPSATRPGTCAGDPSTVLRRRFIDGASAAHLAAAPAAQDDSIAAGADDSRVASSRDSRVPLAATHQSSALRPRAFQRGRRCRRRMRGLVPESGIDIRGLSRTSASSSGASQIFGSAPSSAFGTFSPTKSVGEKDARLGSCVIWIIAASSNDARLGVVCHCITGARGTSTVGMAA